MILRCVTRDWLYKETQGRGGNLEFAQRVPRLCCLEEEGQGHQTQVLPQSCFYPFPLHSWLTFPALQARLAPGTNGLVRHSSLSSRAPLCHQVWDSIIFFFLVLTNDPFILQVQRMNSNIQVSNLTWRWPNSGFPFQPTHTFYVNLMKWCGK